jgi:hypothetical protein
MTTTVEKESSETGQEDGEKQVAEEVDEPSASVPWYKFDNVTVAQGYNTVRSSSR